MRIDAVGDGASVPTPPWRRPTPKAAAPKRPVTRDLILSTALRLIAEDGLDALTMRRIADELGTGPATLYSHIANKDDLLELALDQVLGEVDLPADGAGPWPDILRDVAWSMWRVLISHGDLARASLGRTHTGPAILRISEALVSTMINGGVPDATALAARDRLLLYICADAYEASLYLAKLRAFGPEAVEGFLNQVRTYLRSLSPDTFPYTVRHADGLVGGPCDDRFRTGLDFLIAGLAATVEPAGRPPRRAPTRPAG